MRRPTEQLPDYSAYPDFFVGPIGLFEIWRSAILRFLGVVECVEVRVKQTKIEAELMTQANILS